MPKSGVIEIDPHASDPPRQSPFGAPPSGPLSRGGDGEPPPGSRTRRLDQGADPDLAGALRDLVRFIGPNAASYLPQTPAARSGVAGWRVAFRTGDFLVRWHWPAFLATVPWLFYRKLYAGGLILVGIPVVLNLVVPGGLFLGWAFITALVAGLFARRWYLDHARRQILQAHRTISDEPSRNAFLRRAGGVSVPGAVLGLAIEIATAAATLSGLLNGVDG